MAICWIAAEEGWRWGVALSIPDINSHQCRNSAAVQANPAESCATTVCCTATAASRIVPAPAATGQKQTVGPNDGRFELPQVPLTS